MQLVFIVITVIAALTVIVAVLLQDGKSAGMGGAVGGGSETMFGKTKTKGLQALLQRVTIISSAIFMISVFVLSVII